MEMEESQYIECAYFFKAFFFKQFILLIFNFQIQGILLKSILKMALLNSLASSVFNYISPISIPFLDHSCGSFFDTRHTEASPHFQP